MLAMRREGITEVLTDDDHFTQEGFTILLSLDVDVARGAPMPRRRLPRDDRVGKDGIDGDKGLQKVS
jgi:hypothetical protein